MTGVWFRVRSELRAHRRATVALVLLIALASGVVMAAAVGARRSATAFPRSQRVARAHDATLSGDLRGLEATRTALDALPEVRASGIFAGIAIRIVDPVPADPHAIVVPPLAIIDDRYGQVLDRPRLIAGRMPDYAREDEALANRQMATALGLHPGSRVTVARIADPATTTAPPVRTTLTVTGIALLSTEILPVARFDSFPFLYTTPAFFRAHGGESQALFAIEQFVLRAPSDAGRFRTDAQRIFAGAGLDFNQFIFSTEAERSARVSHALAPLSFALLIFALIAGATALLLLGQMNARRIYLDSTGYETLRALGMTQRQLYAIIGARVLLVAALGALGGVAIAVALSPLTPIGAARLAEPTPGIDINVAALAIGAAATIFGVIAVSAFPARRAARTLEERRAAPVMQRSHLASSAAAAGAPVTAVAGVRMAMEKGAGRTAVPVRSAIFGASVALAAVVATVTFGSSLTHLVRTPTSYGRTWDVQIDGEFSTLPAVRQRALRDAPGVGALAGGNYGGVLIGGHTVSAIGLESLKGDVFPTLLEGRAPQAPDEIVLGTQTMRRAHAHVGDVIDVVLQRPEKMRVVGRAVFPRFGPGIFTPTGLGEGAVLASERLADPSAPAGNYTFLLVRYAAGGDHRAVDRLVQAACINYDNVCLVERGQRPADIGTYAGVTAAPLVLCGVLGLLGLVTVGNALITAVRRRRRDLAILKTLGFLRRQVSSTVAWHATVLVVIAAAFGVPVGVAIGRWGWSAFAGQLGIPGEPSVPLRAVLALIPATIVLANLIAAFPARAAARTHPAVVLRSE